ncbi:MAG: hypothetical protein CM15mP33_02460 [Candidatus Neomarinimicrobiota bacterium]|nr:MAG: hypothetical protein CM15mP33_02460 [Candidatus Neomarinimicrobiota bacterium]
MEKFKFFKNWVQKVKLILADALALQETFTPSFADFATLKGLWVFTLGHIGVEQ